MAFFVPSSTRTCRTLLGLAALICLAAALSGCGSGPIVTSSAGTVHIQGQVHGGQQPVSGGSIFLYTAGKTGNGSPANPILNNPVTTDGDGYFVIGGDYTCGAATDQAYLVAVGGNPGFNPAVNNKALVLMAALGNCGNLQNTAFITINEVTTAAAVWALAPFMKSYANVGASSTNTMGMLNAFLDAQLLANTTTGTTATLPSNLKIEPAKLYSLANAIASCVNTDGGSGCTPLFSAATPSGGTPPTDTLGATLNIVRNPGQNIVAVYNAAQSGPPFQPALTSAPNDWTMSLNVTGGGLSEPETIEIDSNGYVWVAGYGDGVSAGDQYSGMVSEFSPQGTPLSPAQGFGYGLLDEVRGLAIDTTGNIWVTNQEFEGSAHGSITGFYGSNSGKPGTVITNTNSATGGTGSPYFYDTSANTPTFFPAQLSANANGQIFILNGNANFASVFNTSTQAISSLSAINSPTTAFPAAIAADSSGGVWLANSDGGCIQNCSSPPSDSGPGGINDGIGDSSISHITAAGANLQPVCCYGGSGLATDSSSNVWVVNYWNGSVSEVAPDGTVLVNQIQAGGVQHASGISIDAGKNLWIANSGSGSTTQGASFSGISTSTMTGLSPVTSGCITDSLNNTSCKTIGGFGIDAGMKDPIATITDRSGNVWVTSHNTDSLVMFFGLATPTSTPIVPAPTAP